VTTRDLQPGDVLLYAPSSFWTYAIAVKTWNKVSHCEIFIGEGQSVASRDGIGVGQFPLRTSGLTHVVRPPRVDMGVAMAWFDEVNGQGYDWWGLTRFILWGATPANNPDKMFCSEFATRWLRRGGAEPFAPNVDADAVAPAQFLYIPPPWICARLED
jgi:hypothetical protein